jgi:hypothetical protein
MRRGGATCSHRRAKPHRVRVMAIEGACAQAGRLPPENGGRREAVRCYDMGSRLAPFAGGLRAFDGLVDDIDGLIGLERLLRQVRKCPGSAGAFTQSIPAFPAAPHPHVATAIDH